MRMYQSRTWVLALATSVVGVAACATAKPAQVGDQPDASQGSGDPDAMVIMGRPDAPPVPDAPPGTPDASVPDAFVPPPDAPITGGTITMIQTTAQNIVTGNSVSCNDGSPFYDTAENSYYRAFKLSDYGVSGTFHVAHVDFGIETATAGGASQSVTVKIYNYTGTTGGTTLDTTKMTMVGSKTVTIPDTSSGEMITATVTGDITAPAMVAEVFVADGETVGNSLFIGSNTSGESQPGYIRAPACSNPNPASFASLSLPTAVDIVLTVTGSYP